MQPITANITTPGEFREKNPEQWGNDMYPSAAYQEWETEHPILPALDPSNNPLPKGWSDKVVEVWQVRHKADAKDTGWQDAVMDYKDYQDFQNTCKYLDTRRIYRSIEPVEAVKEVDKIQYPFDELLKVIGNGIDEHLKLLNEVNKSANMENHDGFWDYQTVADSNEAFNDLSRHIAQWQSQQDRDGWVRLEDSEYMQMPPFEEKTQIICADGEQYIGYFNGADKYGYVWFCDNNDYHYPTHWRELPAPPQQALTPKDN